MPGKGTGHGYYMISAVARRYDIHPQTLRMYEREGLLAPSRTEGNTRLYSDEDLVQLETILSLTRELGVNLAGVEIILNMRSKMDRMQEEVNEFMVYVKQVAIILADTMRARQDGRRVHVGRIDLAKLMHSTIFGAGGSIILESPNFNSVTVKCPNCHHKMSAFETWVGHLAGKNQRCATQIKQDMKANINSASAIVAASKSNRKIPPMLR